MAKKIGVDIAPPTRKKVAAKSNVTKSEPSKLVDLNFKVSSEFKKDFKQLALDLELNQKQVLEKAVELLKDDLAK